MRRSRDWDARHWALSWPYSANCRAWTLNATLSVRPVTSTILIDCSKMPIGQSLEYLRIVQDCATVGDLDASPSLWWRKQHEQIRCTVAFILLGDLCADAFLRPDDC